MKNTDLQDTSFRMFGDAVCVTIVNNIIILTVTNF